MGNMTALWSFVVVLLFSTCTMSSVVHDLVKRQVQGTPTCGQPLYTGVTNENSPPGTFVVRAAATSATNNPLIWSIQDTTFQTFQINRNTGDITVSASLARRAQQRSALEFRIRATDSINQLYCESTVRVNILPASATTQAPIQQQMFFSQASYTFTVSAFGGQIGQVTVTNPSGGTVVYQITGTSLFSINQQTGQITANGQLQPGTYTFTVSALSASGTVSTQVTVTVSGSQQQIITFPQSSYTFSTGGSSCNSGTQIGQISATSNGGPTYYSLTGTNQFTINQQTGQITLNGNLGSGSYTFNVVATSSGGQQAMVPVTIQSSCGQTAPIIQAQAPSFSQSAYTVTLGQCTQGATVARVQAGGSASTPTTYSVQGTNLFTIDSISGQLSVGQNIQSGTYTFQIAATSIAGQATASVTVNVSCAAQPIAQPTVPQGQYYFTAGSCPAGTNLGSICAQFG